MAYTYNPIYHHLKGKNVTRSELVEYVEQVKGYGKKLHY